jgi:hypothetical protein
MKSFVRNYWAVFAFTLYVVAMRPEQVVAIHEDPNVEPGTVILVNADAIEEMNR